MFAALVCSIFILCSTREIVAQIHPSLREAWNTAHLNRFEKTQTTVDTLFEIVAPYKTTATLTNAYRIDLTADDLEMLRQFAHCFEENRSSYKKKHSFWFIRLEYYKRVLKASRAKELIRILSEGDSGIRISNSARMSAAHENPPSARSSARQSFSVIIPEVSAE